MRGNEKVLVCDAETNVDILAPACACIYLLEFGRLLRKARVFVGHFCLC